MTNQFERPEQNIMLDGAFIGRLRAAVEDLFTINELRTPKTAPQGTIIFRGELRFADSEYVYDQIATRWAVYDYTPMLRRAGDQVELIAHPGVIEPKPSNPIINLILFIITLASVLIVSAMSTVGDALWEDLTQLKEGLPFTLAFLAILGAHEFGHYFVARYHKVAVTLPYFIPFPTIWGTLGAYIQLRSPTITRKQLFDVGVAGPLAGLVLAVPILIIGLFMSTVEPLPSGPEAFFIEGNSIFYWGLKYLIFGQHLPGNGVDVLLHPLAWAGWSGLFVTVLNLLPIGQLDGGHVIYVLLGDKSRQLGLILMGIMVVLGIFLWQGWLFWALITFFLIGVGHPPPLNDLVQLDSKRRFIAYLVVIIFILLFMPSPINIIGG
jgi:membrane-associated protease RseP (regulator of RpoE activity)